MSDFETVPSSATLAALYDKKRNYNPDGVMVVIIVTVEMPEDIPYPKPDMKPV